MLSFSHSSRLINISGDADYLSSSTSSTGMNMFSKWIYKFNLPSEHFAALFTRCTFEAVICTIFENRFNQFFCLSDSKIPLYSRKISWREGTLKFPHLVYWKIVTLDGHPPYKSVDTLGYWIYVIHFWVLSLH